MKRKFVLGLSVLLLGLLASASLQAANLTGTCGMVINAAGTYVLQNDINNCNPYNAVPSQIAAITIQADNVVLDLNGHKVTGAGGNGIMIYGAKNVTIRNGTVEKFTGQGIVILSNAELVKDPSDIIIEKMTIQKNLRGIYGNRTGTLKNLTIRNSYFTGNTSGGAIVLFNGEYGKIYNNNVTQPATCNKTLNIGGCVTTTPTVYRMGSNSSRFGLRGTESLGGGLNAIFQVESSIDPAHAGGTLAGRESFVGLQGGWGTVKIGRFLMPYDDIHPIFGNVPTLTTSILSTASLWAQGFQPKNTGGFDDRVGSSIRYDTPNLSGFTASFQYGQQGNNYAASNGGTIPTPTTRMYDAASRSKGIASNGLDHFRNHSRIVMACSSTPKKVASSLFTAATLLS